MTVLPVSLLSCLPHVLQRGNALEESLSFCRKLLLAVLRCMRDAPTMAYAVRTSLDAFGVLCSLQCCLASVPSWWRQQLVVFGYINIDASVFTWQPCNVGSAANCAANSCCCSHCSVFADHFSVMDLWSCRHFGLGWQQQLRAALAQSWLLDLWSRGCMQTDSGGQRCTCAATASCRPALHHAMFFCLCCDPGDGSFSAGAMAVLTGHGSGVQLQLQVLLRAHYSRERVTQAALQALPMLKLACLVHCHLLQVLFFRHSTACSCPHASSRVGLNAPAIFPSERL